MDDIKSTWYRGLGSSISGSTSHYNSTRYHGLNLHSYFYRGTVEFRLFNASLNCSKIQAYIMLCLFIAVNALNMDLEYPNIHSEEVSISFMHSNFKHIIGLPFRDWVSPASQDTLISHYDSLVYRLSH